MRCLHMRTRKLGGQRAIDIEARPMPVNEDGDNAEVVVSFKGMTQEQSAIIGLRPREAGRLGRLLIQAYGQIRRQAGQIKKPTARAVKAEKLAATRLHGRAKA